MFCLLVLRNLVFVGLLCCFTFFEVPLFFWSSQNLFLVYVQDHLKIINPYHQWERLIHLFPKHQSFQVFVFNSDMRNADLRNTSVVSLLRFNLDATFIKFIWTSRPVDWLFVAAIGLVFVSKKWAFYLIISRFKSSLHIFRSSFLIWQ